MSDSKDARRFHRGGMLHGLALSPNEFPVPLSPHRPWDFISSGPPRERSATGKMIATAANIQAHLGHVADPRRGDATMEAVARKVTFILICEFGVSEPLLAFRQRERPMTQMDSMVLDKLETVYSTFWGP